MTEEKINYIELLAQDIEGTKRFFSEAFGWRFVDYGPDYSAMEDAGLDGGFFRSDLVARTESGSALVVLYSSDLEASFEKVKKAGGDIVKPTFDFPGGRRFHLTIKVKTEGSREMVRAGNTLTVLTKRDGRWLLYRDANLLVPEQQSSNAT